MRTMKKAHWARCVPRFAATDTQDRKCDATAAALSCMLLMSARTAPTATAKHARRAGAATSDPGCGSVQAFAGPVKLASAWCPFVHLPRPSPPHCVLVMPFRPRHRDSLLHPCWQHGVLPCPRQGVRLGAASHDLGSYTRLCTYTYAPSYRRHVPDRRTRASGSGRDSAAWCNTQRRTPFDFLFSDLQCQALRVDGGSGLFWYGKDRPND